MDWAAASVSFRLASLTALVLLPLALLLGRWLAISEAKARPVVEALLLLPLLLPPTVIGFYLLSAFGRNSVLGAALGQLTGISLVFSFEGLLLASLLVNLPFMVQPIQRAFAAIPNSLREAAWVCGLSGLSTFLRVELPLAWPGILAGIALTFAHTLGEFGVVLMVGVLYAILMIAFPHAATVDNHQVLARLIAIALQVEQQLDRTGPARRRLRPAPARPRGQRHAEVAPRTFPIIPSILITILKRHGVQRGAHNVGRRRGYERTRLIELRVLGEG